MINNKITLFDPSLSTNNGGYSINLGDLIIHESVEKYLKDIFLDGEIFRISSHQIPSDFLLQEARKSPFIFFGGTNALSSDLKKYNQWKLPIPNKIFWSLKFPIKNLILMGVGWWRYQNQPTSYTSAFYKTVLSDKYIHSVRDSYTKNKLKEMGIENAVNTGCPTMWMLSGKDVSSRVGHTENCLFTLTDYNRNPEIDNKIIKIILGSYAGKVFFFPQGSDDSAYISTLSSYQQYYDRITIITRNFGDFVSTLAKNNVDYIGTRLHAGIKALQMNKNTLILSIDNRATEISNDTGLPVVKREDISEISRWIAGVKIFDTIRMPEREIEIWKMQFQKN